MSKLSRRVYVLEVVAQAQRKKIGELETKIEINAQVEYGRPHWNALSTTRLEVPVIDVVNSILKHLELEISHKSLPVSTESMVVFKSTKKKSTAKKKK